LQDKYFPLSIFHFPLLCIDRAYRRFNAFHVLASPRAKSKNPHKEYPNTPTVLENQSKYRSVELVVKAEEVVAKSEWIPLLPRRRGCPQGRVVGNIIKSISRSTENSSKRHQTWLLGIVLKKRKLFCIFQRGRFKF
ncbi:hypothetical protein EZS27_044222, partial [termite gut metagenome]